MKKNFRRIPGIIDAKINAALSDAFEVCIVKKIRENDFNSFGFINFQLSVDGNNLVSLEEFIPEANRGSFSRKNVNGYKVVFRDREKVLKRWYAGERPFFGDWSRGSFSLYVSKLVYPSIAIPPKELSINLDLLNDEIIEGERYFTFKIYINEILNRNELDFRESLLFNVNLLQENFGDADVFESTFTREDYLRTLIVDWDFFPPGNRDTDIQRILQRRLNANRNYQNSLADRYDVMMSLDPINVISGKSGMRNYFGVQFGDNLVAFENLQYGNAIYILFENWRELSTLSRTELLTRPEDQFYRVKHKFGWQTKFARIINGKRN